MNNMKDDLFDKIFTIFINTMIVVMIVCVVTVVIPGMKAKLIALKAITSDNDRPIVKSLKDLLPSYVDSNSTYGIIKRLKSGKCE